MQWLQDNPLLLIVAGVVLLFLVNGGNLTSMWTAIKAWWDKVMKKEPTPTPTPEPVITPDPTACAVDAFLVLKAYLINCPQAKAPLSSLWNHLEPGHIEGPAPS